MMKRRDALLTSGRAANGGQIGFQQHPLEQIVNVNWGGLAVIFGERDQDAPEQGATR